MRPLLDAHNHLQDPGLAPHLEDLLAAMSDEGIARSVVNGTTESDWPAVAALATRHPAKVHPSFGLHPWYVAGRSPQWLESLARFLAGHPGSGVGECGLDRWIKDHDLEDQLRALIPQIELATTLARPLTLHCLQAWGPLLDCLQGHPLPARGFLLHAYGGSRELVSTFADLGAYFSFSGSFLHEHKEARREVFRTIPRDRLLIETDAPAMALPPALQAYQVPHNPELNHPANLGVTFRHLADLLALSPEETSELLHKNATSFLAP